MTLGTKYLVVRKNGTIPKWPYFVLGGKDRAAPAALRSYAVMCKVFKVDSEYIDSVIEHARKMSAWADHERPENRDIDEVDVLTIAKALLGELTNEQRTEVFNHLQAKFCIYCGREHPDGVTCRCEDDS